MTAFEREYRHLMPDDKHTRDRSSLPEPSKEVKQLVVDINWVSDNIHIPLSGADLGFLMQNLVLEAAKAQVVNRMVSTPDEGEEA